MYDRYTVSTTPSPLQSSRRHMIDPNIRKSHRRPQRRARTRIAPTHDRRAGVPARIQPADRPALRVDHPRELVRQQPALGAQVARVQPHGVEGRGLDGAEVGVGRVGRVAEVAVEGRRAAAEVVVLAGARQGVEPRQRLRQAGGVDARLAGEVVDGGGLDEEAGLDGGFGLDEGRQHGQAVAALEGRVDDQPGRDGLGDGVALELDAAGVDVGLGFVHEALAAVVDADGVRERAVPGGEVGPVAGDHDGWAPPSLVHQCGLSIGLNACLDGIAGVI